jgi:hypothetical protein
MEDGFLVQPIVTGFFWDDCAEVSEFFINGNFLNG